MYKKFSTALLSMACLCLLIIVVASCGDDEPTGPSGNNYPVITFTPLEEERAELMAMWQSDSLEAPVELYEQILVDLRTIENQWNDTMAQAKDSAMLRGYHDSLPDWILPFYPYWQVSKIWIGFNNLQSWNQAQSGLLEEFNRKLNENNFSHVTYDSLFGYYYNASVHFNGRLNSKHLVDAFAGVEGIYSVTTSNMAGDYSVLLPVGEPGERKYYYRFAWGDCPSGCTISENFYYEMDADSAMLLGRWGASHMPQPTPAWIDTLQATQWRWRLDYASWVDTLWYQ